MLQTPNTEERKKIERLIHHIKREIVRVGNEDDQDDTFKPEQSRQEARAGAISSLLPEIKEYAPSSTTSKRTGTKGPLTRNELRSH